MFQRLFVLIFILALTSFEVSASASRTIEGDIILSSDHSKNISLPSATDTLVGRTSTDSLSNKTISGSSNTLSNLPVATEFARDSFSGNSSTTAFTLSNTPAINAQVQVYQNGLLLTITTDYTISGTTLTMITAPATGQNLLVIYSKH